jgi:solute carrier family 30 (zinc transporter), member 5/7
LNVFILIIGQYLVYKVPAASAFGNLPLDRGGSFSTALGTVIRDLTQRIKENKDARNIFLYSSLNLVFMFLELGYGMWNNSLGLISDGFHMFFDSSAVMIGLIAMVIAEWQPNKMYSFGYGRVNVLSGFINAIFLVFIACSVFYEAIQRFIEPPHVENDKLLLVSVLGLVVNLVGLFVFSQAHNAAHGHSHSHGHSHAHGSKKEKTKKKHGHSHAKSSEDCENEELGLHDDHGHAHEEDHHGHSHAHGAKKVKKEKKHDDDHEDENLHGIFLHVLGDTLGSVGVIISSIFIEFFNWTISDPICSVIIAFFLFLSVGPLLKSTSSTLLQKTPKKLDRKLEDLLRSVQEVPNVVGVSSPHFWSTDGTEMIGSIHVMVSAQANSQSVIQRVNAIFSGAGVTQMTIQVEQAGAGEEHLIPSSNWN